MSYAADIESIFNPCNLDEDCSYIAHLLSPYEKLIVARMDAGDYTCAVTVFLEILETLTRHPISTTCIVRSMFAMALCRP